MAKKRDIVIKNRKPAGQDSKTPETGTVPISQKRPVEPVSRADNPMDTSPELEVLPKRKRRRRSTLVRIICRLLIVAVVFVAGVLVWKNWDTLAPESLVIWIEEKLSGGENGGGFPVEIVGSEVSAMMEVKGNLAVLGDTSLLLYNSRGGLISSRPHGYASPLMKTAGEYILIMEAGGTRFRLETRGGTTLDVPINNQKTENGKTFDVLDTPLTNHIITGAVDSKGNIALITGASQSHMSEILVYNKKGKLLYARQNAELIAVDVAFSPNGKNLAVAGITGQDGALKSSVLIFDMGSTSNMPVKEYSDTDVMMCKVEYFPSGTVIAIGDTAAWVMNPKGELFEKYGYAEDELIGYVVGDSAGGIVLRRYGNTDGGHLLVLNPSGDQAYSADFEGAFRHVSSAKDGFWLLTEKQLLHGGTKGFDFNRDVASDGRLVSSLGDRAVIMGLTSLQEYSKGN